MPRFGGRRTVVVAPRPVVRPIVPMGATSMLTGMMVGSAIGSASARNSSNTCNKCHNSSCCCSKSTTVVVQPEVIYGQPVTTQSLTTIQPPIVPELLPNGKIIMLQSTITNRTLSLTVGNIPFANGDFINNYNKWMVIRSPSYNTAPNSIKLRNMGDNRSYLFIDTNGYVGVTQNESLATLYVINNHSDKIEFSNELGKTISVNCDGSMKVGTNVGEGGSTFTVLNA